MYAPLRDIAAAYCQLHVGHNRSYIIIHHHTSSYIIIQLHVGHNRSLSRGDVRATDADAATPPRVSDRVDDDPRRGGGGALVWRW